MVSFLQIRAFKHLTNPKITQLRCDVPKVRPIHVPEAQRIYYSSGDCGSSRFGEASTVSITGGWWQPALAFVLFLLAHRWPTRPAIRAALVRRLGAPGFTLLYSLLSLVLLGWLIAATLSAPVIVLWYYAPWQSWVPLLAMLPACLVFGSAVATPNPLSFGGARNKHFDPAAPGVVGFCRHPLLLALTLWAGAHTIPNGELATLLLFLPLAIFSLYGMHLIDRRRKTALGDTQWQAMAARTALLPGGAMLTGRWQPDWRRAPWGHLLIGLSLYGVLLWAHPRVIGVPAMPAGLVP